MHAQFDILVAGKLDKPSLDALARVGVVRFPAGHNEASLIDAVANADALVVRTSVRVTGRVIEAGKRLKVIGRGGVGLDHIDIPAARRRGITVVYTPEAASDAAAELTVGLMIALERKIATGQQMLRAGQFAEAREVCIGRGLAGLTLGIVGMGRIGRRVGRIAGLGLGMRVMYNDLVAIDGLDIPAEPVAKERIWSECDVVTLHVPLTDQTHQMINAAVFVEFKPTATLINTARGAVIDAQAVADALSQGRLAGAAVDVFDPEPPPPDHPLLSAPNVLLTPHIAARTHDGLARMNAVVDDVIAVLESRPPRFAAPVS